MDNKKLAFIMACKSEDDLAGVYEVYNEHYGKCASESLRDKEVVKNLSNIVDLHLNVPAWEWIADLCPERKEYFGVTQDDSHLKHAILVLIKRIKLSENSILNHCEGF
jgi:hypothetical protein